jgi:hypothetical protein
MKCKLGQTLKLDVQIMYVRELMKDAHVQVTQIVRTPEKYVIYRILIVLYPIHGKLKNVKLKNVKLKSRVKKIGIKPKIIINYK